MIKIAFNYIETSTDDVVLNLITPEYTVSSFEQNKLIKKGGVGMIEELMSLNDDNATILDVDEYLITDGHNTDHVLIMHVPFPWVFEENTKDARFFAQDLINDTYISVIMLAFENNLTSVGLPIMYMEQLDADVAVTNAYAVAKLLEEYVSEITFYTTDTHVLEAWVKYFN